MPWQEVTRVSAREEFVQLAMQVGSNRRELCRRFGISPQTGYKWLARYTLEGLNGLCERSRRPRHSPARTVDEVAEHVIELRREGIVLAKRRGAYRGRKKSLSTDQIINCIVVIRMARRKRRWRASSASVGRRSISICARPLTAAVNLNWRPQSVTSSSQKLTGSRLGGFGQVLLCG
jgi:transposase-like protein